MMGLGVEMRDHVLRISDGAVIDRPDDLQPRWPVVSGGTIGWVASWYPDSATPGGFQRFDWPASRPRGFMIPNHSATGDIIEFGLAWDYGEGRIDGSTAERWFGWLNYGTGRALVVKGRYPTLESAAAQAAVVVDLVRLSSINPDMSFDMTQIDPTIEADER